MYPLISKIVRVGCHTQHSICFRLFFLLCLTLPKMLLEPQGSGRVQVMSWGSLHIIVTEAPVGSNYRSRSCCARLSIHTQWKWQFMLREVYNLCINKTWITYLLIILIFSYTSLFLIIYIYLKRLHCISLFWLDAQLSL